MLYYFLVMVAILLFGGNFFINGRYQQRVGSSFVSSVILAFGTGLSGCLCLLAFNGFRVHWTPFTLLMSACFAMSGILMTICTVFSLEKASLSLYSAFSMIGGMICPSVVGMIFFSEEITWNKIVCYVLTIIGLSLTVKKEKKNKAFMSYLGVFLFNGTSAAISTIFSKADFEKAASSDYSILGAAFKAIFAGLVIPAAIIMAKKAAAESDSDTDVPALSPGKYAAPAVIIFLVLCGVFNTVANYLLPIAMTDGGLDGSVVYPMITGGVMIVSTVLGYLNKRKPTRREVLAVVICTLGILFLVIPAALA